LGDTYSLRAIQAVFDEYRANQERYFAGEDLRTT